MDDRAGGGVQFPFDQPVLWSQLHRVALVKNVLQRPATLLSFEHHGQLEGGGDARVGGEGAQGLEPVLGLNIDLDTGPAQSAGLVCRGAHHVPGDPGGHLSREQESLAVQGGGFGGGQAELQLTNNAALQKSLFVLQSRIQRAICNLKKGR